MLACGNMSRSKTEEANRGNEFTSRIIDDENGCIDTVAGNPSEAVIDETKKASPISSFTSDNYNEDYDNMRGFDPASEDDMNDNGLSRYMENNDDVGWD